jgi:CBS domain-containing protein
MNLREARLETALTAPAATPVIDIAKLLGEHKRRHIYILDEKEFPVGIISITDLVSRIVAQGKSPQGLVASQVMNTPLHMVEIDNDIDKAYFEMIGHDTIAIPVIDNGVLAGVLSMNEALRLMVSKRGR